VCIDNEDYAASLEKRKIYAARRDPAAEERGLLRLIDKSGDATCSDVGRRSSFAAWARREGRAFCPPFPLVRCALAWRYFASVIVV
jgi:hypothetical protein